MEKVLLSAEELQEMSGIKLSTLAKWRHLGKGPAYFKLHGMVRYAAEDVKEWLESNKVKTYD